MPEIRASAELRNKYNEISAFCHKYNEPVFLTKNGRGDLAVMSIEAYETLLGKKELCRLLEEGMVSIKAGKTRPAEEVFKEIQAFLAPKEQH